MGRVCKVLGCPSGSQQDIKYRKKIGVRQTSIFQVPKCQNKRKKWSEAVASELKFGDYICEHHFNTRDVKTQDRTVMPDGTIVVIPLQHHVLIHDAVPMSQLSMSETSEVFESATNENLSFTGTPSPSQQSAHFDDVLNETHQTQNNTNNDELLEKESRPMNRESPDRLTLPVEKFTIESLTRALEVTPLPKGWSWMFDPEDKRVLRLFYIDITSCKLILNVKVDKDMFVTSQAPEGSRPFAFEKITSIGDLVSTIKVISKKRLCVGSDMKQESRAPECMVIMEGSTYNVRHPRCIHCRRLRIKWQNRTTSSKNDLESKYQRVRRQLDLERRKNKRLRKQGEKLKNDILHARKKCAAVSQSAIDEVIGSLPEAQQEAVKACLSAAKVSNSKRRRYTLEWVYECNLMRIKNGRLYEHLRSRNILPLPCKDTINRYIQKMNSAYGFQSAVFDCLAIKSSHMEPNEKRGVLLIDEMSLSQAISLDTNTMNFKGFVDLGNFTPEEQQNERADHALVFMFQPFRGKRVQVLGSFLSKNSVTSQILHKLVLECLILLNESGFHVDVITMDGAQWNRGVWSKFGIKDGNYSCEHPSDCTRRLWMVSDFPHLIKCLRNGLMKLDSFWTPDGIVKKDHWRALLDGEGYAKCNLRIAYKLTPIHLNPKGYQTMNVPLAFELFSDRVRTAMQMLKEQNFPRLQAADPTIKLCKIVNDLIQAMMSRTPATALRPTDRCIYKKAIQDFDRYLRNWAMSAKAEGMSLPISASTLSGLKVTLGSTLELIQFLHEEHNFDYLMTARLNQDALERFFGMMRNACGSNDHPDPTLFAQVFRLLTCYSLVKPPKGGNVSGTELLQTLMEARESIATAGFSKEEWIHKIDAIIENGSSDEQPDDDCPMSIITMEHDYETTQERHCDHMTTHDYDVTKTSDEVQSYIAGYVARKVIRFTKCGDCVSSTQTHERADKHRLIDLMNHYGGLLYPSDQLLNLIKTLEDAILDVVGKLTVKMNTLHQILDRVTKIENLPYVGCKEHHKQLTKSILNFYVVTRGHFLAKAFNENNNAKKIKSKTYRKNSKL